MSWGESDRWLLGEENARYYHDDLEDAGARPERDASRRKTIKAQELPWENSPHGLLKHLANPQMDLRIETIDAYMQIIPPGSHSCLLYTSPSPRDRTRSRMPSSA